MLNFQPGTGADLVYNVTAPGAGNNLVYPVPSQTRWTLLGCIFVLTTSADVFTREAAIVAVRDSVAFEYIDCALDQTASLSFIYRGVAGLGTAASAIGDDQIFPLPYPFNFRYGDDVAIIVNSLRPGDAITSIYLHVEEWRDPVL